MTYLAGIYTPADTHAVQPTGTRVALPTAIRANQMNRIVDNNKSRVAEVTGVAQMTAK